MDTEPQRIPRERSLSEQKRGFINSLRTRKTSSDEPLMKLMREVNAFPPEAKDYLSFLTNIFLEKDVYEKIISKPDSKERIMARLLNSGLSLEQAQATLNYFQTSHTSEEPDQDNSAKKDTT